MLQTVAVAQVMICWFLWTLAFANNHRRAFDQKKLATAPHSKWGIVLQALGVAMMWAYVRPAGFEKSPLSLAAAMILAPPSALLAWIATRHLGKQWRYEASLVEGHELIQTGPYQWVRHPIYTSMLGMLIATWLAWTWWPVGVAALIVFITGTEIRTQAEDRLLAEYFRDHFLAYRRRVRSYIPFVY